MFSGWSEDCVISTCIRNKSRKPWARESRVLPPISVLYLWSGRRKICLTVHVEVQWVGGQSAGSLVKAYHWGWQTAVFLLKVYSNRLYTFPLASSSTTSRISSKQPILIEFIYLECWNGPHQWIMRPAISGEGGTFESQTRSHRTVPTEQWSPVDGRCKQPSQQKVIFIRNSSHRNHEGWNRPALPSSAL